MKLVMTLLVRDEADVVDSQISYHLNSGVDFILATDHDSHDGTTEILESYERDGALRLFRVHGEMKDGEWRTRMARLAATDHAADWVINTDADEFWMPRAGTLEEVFQAIPKRVGIFWAPTCHFVPRPDDGALFAERMTARFSAQAPLNDPTSPYRPHAKVAHRADRDIVVWFGSHRVVSKRLAPLPGLHPADVCHFPFRSLEQYERKNVRRARGDKPLGQYVKGLQARDQGTIEDVYRQLVVSDEALGRGVASGALVTDTRVRDALRELGGGTTLPPPRAGDGAIRFAGDEAALQEADLVRLVRRLDILRTRLESIEARGWSRSRRRGQA